MARTDTDFYEETMQGVDLSPALVVGPTSPVGDVIRAMQKKHCGCAVLFDGTRVVGTFTERTLIDRGAADGVDLAAPVGQFANTDVPVLRLEDTVERGIAELHEKGVRHLPVQNGSVIVGVLSVRDVIGLVAQYNPEEIYNLPPRVRQEMKSVDGA